MRTTIRLNDALLKKAKQEALERDISLTKLIEEALIDKIAKKTGTRVERKINLATFYGDGLQPGVDLDDSASLLDLMDSTR